MIRSCCAVLACAGLGVGTLVWPASVSADNFSGATGNTGCVGGLNEADNYYHSFYYDNLHDVTRIPANNTRLDDLEPTVINTEVVNNTSSSVDVAVHDNDYSDFCGYNWYYVIGLTNCSELTNGARFCDKHQVYIDLSDFNNLGLAERNSVMCNEFGHTLGLQHRDAGCMTSPVPPFRTNYTDHDRDHLRQNY